MNAMQFAKGMSIGMGVGMAVGTAAGWMMHPQKRRTNNIVADAVRTVSDVTAQGLLLIFFRYTSLKLLGVHKVRRRRFASSNEKISRRTCG